ncbi:hypothetical protein EYF80_032942 [Liparis tanakae]|uniref:Uncharacterized protein n=1 Tax=Liparis tanakae TaxID=230148 RepID=A0A4Z2GTK4_9TELE|nr:hypothetical protein EYF80_032942 [Liparis tanakae]
MRVVSRSPPHLTAQRPQAMAEDLWSRKESVSAELLEVKGHGQRRGSDGGFLIQSHACTHGLPPPPAVVQLLFGAQGEGGVEHGVVHGVTHDAVGLRVQALQRERVSA